MIAVGAVFKFYSGVEARRGSKVDHQMATLEFVYMNIQRTQEAIESGVE